MDGTQSLRRRRFVQWRLVSSFPRGWSAARGELYRWFDTAELAYASFAFARPEPR